MKKSFLLIFFISLFLIPMQKIEAQSLSATSSTTVTFENSGFPQWAKDLRRWNIISFGLFPFSMFVVTVATDTVKWYEANGFDFSPEGRRYAPWLLKSAGGVEMTNDEYARTILLAAGLSAAVALVDLLIIKIKRSNERRRIESLPSGSVNIERIPYGVQEENAPNEDNGQVAE